MNNAQQSRQIRIRRFEDNQLTGAETDFVAIEEPLEVRIRGNAIAITMRTPGHDIELAAGFISTEGIIEERSEILEIAHCENGKANDGRNIVNAFLHPAVKIDWEQFKRHFFTNSSCGICGKATIESVQSLFPAITSNTSITTRILNTFPDKLRQAQKTFHETGGLHAAALFTADGSMISIREDVGRHNAVDKVIGHSFLAERKLSNLILMVSGRVSFEIMQKALAHKIPIVAAISAPTSLAIEFATQNKQALVGFMRNNKMNIYAGHEYIN